MVFNDTSGGQGGIQECEDQCGLGRGGITNSSTLFQTFTRWANQWNKIGANYAILAFDGHDFDDPNYTTAPTGYFTGTTNQDYNFDSAYKMLKIKLVNVTYDNANWYLATPFDDKERTDAIKDPNIDAKFSQQAPKYDLIAGGFKLFPKFTSAQVSAGAKVYVEWFRSPREFATSGTDSYEPGFESQFHRLPFIGASYEYAKLYKPDLVSKLEMDIYGGKVNGIEKKGILQEMQEWYASKSPKRGSMTAKQEDTQ